MWQNTQLGLIALSLMAMQFVLKVIVEINMAIKTNSHAIVAEAVTLTIGWLVIIYLCQKRQQLGYWFGAIWGLLNFVMAVPLLRVGKYNFNIFIGLIALNGILIAAFCLVMLINKTKNSNTFHFFPKNKTDAFFFLFLCCASLIRILFITLKEPKGVLLVNPTMAAKVGLFEITSNSLISVVIPSMIALCIIIPGIIIKMRWAYILSAFFGGIHVMLTAMVLITRINPYQFAPMGVILASLGMLTGGIWMINSNSTLQFTI